MNLLPLLMESQSSDTIPENGHFVEQEFKAAVESPNQTFTFCGVGAHHQNGIAEKNNKELPLTAITLLLHSQRHWPVVITTML